MNVTNYSNLSIRELAKLSKDDAGAHPQFFTKLSLSDQRFGASPSFRETNILKIFRDMDAQWAVLASRSLGENYFRSKKVAVFNALEILIQKDLNGTITRVAHLATRMLTKKDNFTLLKQVIEKDAEIGLEAMDAFNITKKMKPSIIKALVKRLAAANKTDKIAPLVILANAHLTKVKKAQLANSIIDVAPKFTLAFIDKLKMKTDDKALIIEKLAEKIPKAFQIVKNGQFYEKISNRTDRINIDAPLFASIKDQKISLKTLVVEHAQKRTHLFFNLLTAYYNTGYSLSLNDTIFRYGKGSRGEEGNFDGAHSSIITSVKIKKTADQDFWNEASFYDLYLAHTCNATFYLPREVNVVDCKIEGSNTNSNKMMRQRSIKILQSVASGKINPEEGMKRYLKQFAKVVRLIKSKVKLTAEHKRYLNYQVEGTNQITNSEGKILGNFFRFNLALSIKEDVEIHSTLSQYKWKDLSIEFKNTLFEKAQKQTQANKVLVVDGKAIQ